MAIERNPRSGDATRPNRVLLVALDDIAISKLHLNMNMTRSQHVIAGYIESQAKCRKTVGKLWEMIGNANKSCDRLHKRQFTLPEHSLSSGRKALESRLWLFLEVLQLNGGCQGFKGWCSNVSPKSPSWFSHLVDIATIDHKVITIIYLKLCLKHFKFSLRLLLGIQQDFLRDGHQSCQAANRTGMNQLDIPKCWLRNLPPSADIKACPCQSAAFGLHLAPGNEGD